LSRTVDIDPLDLIDPDRHQRKGVPHEQLARLRAEDPVAYLEPPGYPGFWAVTKHADVLHAASQPLIFSSAKGITFDRSEEEALAMQGFESLVTMDPPRHGKMRQVANKEFLRSAVRARFEDIGQIARQIVDDAATGGEVAECDFVPTFAGRLPLEVIAWVLGVPKEDWAHLLEATDTVIGKDDPEFRRPGESPDEARLRAQIAMHQYFEAMVEDRRRAPRDDLVTLLTQRDIEGVPLTQKQMVSYCELLVAAGNETTRDAIAAAMHAFCEYPDQWALLRDHSELLPNAIEEILRWVTPINYFRRTATQDYELGTAHIRAGDRVVLFWVSANRDEDVFENPFEFRIDREPNQHVVFGFGPHLCMGAHLARAEIEQMFSLLPARMTWFEPAGPVERLNSSVNGAIKHLPLRYTLQ
jgi:cholest-4-en-3-one 26-monooxygenase